MTKIKDIFTKEESVTTFHGKRERAAKQRRKQIGIWIAVGLTMIGALSTAVITIMNHNQVVERKELPGKSVDELTDENGKAVKSILDGTFEEDQEKAKEEQKAAEEAAKKASEEQKANEEAAAKAVQEAAVQAKVDEAVKAAEAKAKEQIDSLTSTNSQLTKDNETLKANNETLKSNNDTLKSSNDTLKSSNDTLKNNNATLTTERDELLKTATSLESEVKKLKDENASLKRLLENN